jgi:L-ascorbate metabolism protein UlaG (beta-lactamase superfamily)
MAWTILGLIILAPFVSIAIGMFLSAPKYKGPVSDHFDGSKFHNPGSVAVKGGMEVFKWMINRKKKPWTEDLRENYGKRPPDRFKDGIRITFINHSTFLIQVGGLNILTDPIWSKRPSPFPWAGPKRMRLPGIRFEDIPRIHLVLLTHNHYDHLDLPTMRMVFGSHHPEIITPLGIKKFLDQQFIGGSAELDLWEEQRIKDQLTIQAVPAQHFSGRGFLDRDATLWCGYVIKSAHGNIYFAGDTGYNAQTFKEIGVRCGPVKISLLPIGAYQPAWFMSPVHASPEESVKIHLDVGSQKSIGIHFGTFPLADDGPEDPVNDLKIATAKYKLKPEEFIVLNEGEAQIFD